MNKDNPQRGEVLVAIMNNKRDFGILQDERWYRIPVASAPKRFPPRWMAFYQTKKFEQDAYAINFFGEVERIQVVKRRDLFPDEFTNPKSDLDYYRIQLNDLVQLETPIRSTRPRRLVFVPTTWSKFETASQINDLFDDSGLEDFLWGKLKELKISAERQWDERIENEHYRLDFAIFCRKGNIDVEVDGDKWHANPDRASVDNVRNNTLGAYGWTVLRFDERKIKESLTKYCAPRITTAINRLDGLSDEGLVSRKFLNLPEGSGQQLSLFEQKANYEAEDDW